MPRSRCSLRDAGLCVVDGVRSGHLSIIHFASSTYSEGPSAGPPRPTCARPTEAKRGQRGAVSGRLLALVFVFVLFLVPPRVAVFLRPHNVHHRVQPRVQVVVLLLQFGDPLFEFVRSAGSAGRELRDPHSGEQEPGVGDRRHSAPVAGTAEREAAGAVLELPLSGRELVEAETCRRQGGAASQRVVWASRFHRHQHDLAETLGGALLPQGGTAEQWIKEGKQATSWTGLSCHRFRSIEVWLHLAVLAYNLGNLWRCLGLPSRIKRWSLTSLQHRLTKTGGRLFKHARYYWLLLAEGHLNRKLFGEMLARLQALSVPGG